MGCRGPGLASGIAGWASWPRRTPRGWCSDPGAQGLRRGTARAALWLVDASGGASRHAAGTTGSRLVLGLAGRHSPGPARGAPRGPSLPSPGHGGLAPVRGGALLSDVVADASALAWSSVCSLWWEARRARRPRFVSPSAPWRPCTSSPGSRRRREAPGVEEELHPGTAHPADRHVEERAAQVTPGRSILAWAARSLSLILREGRRSPSAGPWPPGTLRRHPPGAFGAGRSLPSSRRGRRGRPDPAEGEYVGAPGERRPGWAVGDMSLPLGVSEQVLGGIALEGEGGDEVGGEGHADPP